MKPQQIANRLDALTTQMYRAMILLERCGHKIDDLAIAAHDEAGKAGPDSEAYHLLRAAHSMANQVTYDLAGLHDEIQERIYKIDSIVSDISVL